MKKTLSVLLLICTLYLLTACVPRIYENQFTQAVEKTNSLDSRHTTLEMCASVTSGSISYSTSFFTECKSVFEGEKEFHNITSTVNTLSQESSVSYYATEEYVYLYVEGRKMKIPLDFFLEENENAASNVPKPEEEDILYLDLTADSGTVIGSSDELTVEQFCRLTSIELFFPDITDIDRCHVTVTTKNGYMTNITYSCTAYLPNTFGAPQADITCTVSWIDPGQSVTVTPPPDIFSYSLIDP